MWSTRPTLLHKWLESPMYVLLADRVGKFTHAQKYSAHGKGDRPFCGEVGGSISLLEEHPQRRELEGWFADRFQRSLDVTDQLLPDSQIFLDAGPLVVACQRSGVMLHCAPGGRFTVGSPVNTQKNPVV